jgi:hypothetical protein
MKDNNKNIPRPAVKVHTEEEKKEIKRLAIDKKNKQLTNQIIKK